VLPRGKERGQRFRGGARCWTHRIALHSIMSRPSSARLQNSIALRDGLWKARHFQVIRQPCQPVTQRGQDGSGTNLWPLTTHPSVAPLRGRSDSAACDVGDGGKHDRGDSGRKKNSGWSRAQKTKSSHEREAALHQGSPTSITKGANVVVVGRRLYQTGISVPRLPASQVEPAHPSTPPVTRGQGDNRIGTECARNADGRQQECDVRRHLSAGRLFQNPPSRVDQIQQANHRHLAESSCRGRVGRANAAMMAWTTTNSYLRLVIHSRESCRAKQPPEVAHSVVYQVVLGWKF